MAEKRKILIAGGGIGGITAALCLVRAGFEVQVFEQANELGEVGAGIQLSANAIRVLEYLGLREKLAEIAAQPIRYEFKIFDTAEVLQKIPLGDTHSKKHGAPYLQFHRADLLAVLVQKAHDVSPSLVHLGKTVTGFDEDEQGVTLKFSDGTTEHGDILIGADGIKSAVRAQIAGDTVPEYTGQVAWRVMVPTSDLPKDFMELITEIWVGPGKHAVVYFLRRGELLNFVGAVDHAEWSEEGWTVKYPWSDMKKDFEGWHPNIQTILDAADHDMCFRWALNNRPPIKNWSTDRATLLGDAAHATLPYMAQGAAMAIEDGAVLARALKASDDVNECLQIYQNSRIERTTKIVNESSANKKLFHLNSTQELKAAFAKRDISSERSNWLFSYDALNEKLSPSI
ncbi:MAG: FAD-dependent monooxygenase [Rhizobiales bacterium]|nr:FAD-dependent monooxygenase [Hyphomicrobiales bacterium]